MFQQIVPVTTKAVDADGTKHPVTVSQDNGIRAGTSLAGLAQLRPAFKPRGSTTAGVVGELSTCVAVNSSQVSDGAAALLIGCRSGVAALGLPVLGVLRESVVVGVPPKIMGIGPVFAIPAALKQAGKMLEVRECLDL